MEEKVYLELVTKRNYKFYELIIKDLVVFISYGKIGKKGILKTFTFNNTTEALQLFSTKLKSKVKKGYKKTIKGLNAPKLQGVHPNQLSFDFKFFNQISYS